MKLMGAAGLASFAPRVPMLDLINRMQEFRGSFTWWRVPPDTPIEQEQLDAFDAAVAQLMPNVQISYERRRRA
jgi:hypothetical protein